jgi:hypothetical protein
MKTTLKMIIAIGSMFMANVLNGNAQVTIGSTTAEPVKAALLDLKDQVSGPDSVTSTTGGLVLPRVKLVSKTTLEPFIRTNDLEWDATNQEKTKKNHVGLTVYNLTSNGNFGQGVYVWTGAAWYPLKVASSYIYLPAFDLPWNDTSIDLFAVYKNNFSPSAASNHVNSRDANVFILPDYDAVSEDFYYVVTDYNSSVIDISNITPQGVMSYSKASALASDPVPPENAYVNVVMVRK